MITFLKDLLTWSIEGQYEFSVLNVTEAVIDEENVYTVKMKIDNLIEERSDESEMIISYPIVKQGTVSVSGKLRTSITTGKRRGLISNYEDKKVRAKGAEGQYLSISLQKKDHYTVINEEEIPSETFLNYFFPKEYKTSVPLSPERVELINNFRFHELCVLKLKLFFKDKEISDRLDAKNVRLLLNLMDIKRSDFPDMPFDFVYFDLENGLQDHLKMTRYSVRSKMLSIYKMTKKYKAYPSPLQGSINKYFSMQTEAIRNLQVTNESNALSVIGQSNKIYFVTSKGNKLAIFNDYFVGFLDPIKTAEGAQTGIKNEFSRDCFIKNQELFINLLTLNFEEVTVKFSDTYLEKVLVADNIDYQNKKLIKDEGVYTVFEFGEYKTQDTTEGIKYLRKENSILSNTASNIPFLNRTDTTRALLGAHMMEQAIPVSGGNPPTINTGYGETVFNKSSLIEKSDVEGKVVEATDALVVVRDEEGIDHIHETAEFLNSSTGTSTVFETRVKKGEKVKKGDPLIVPNSFKGKDLSIGRDLLCAYTTYYALDHEDSMVISESVAKQMAHPSIYTLRIPFYEDINYEFGMGALKELGGWNSKYYGSNGLIKIGADVRRTEILFSCFEIYEPRTDRKSRLYKGITEGEDLKETRIIKVPYFVTEGKVINLRFGINYRSAPEGVRDFVASIEKTYDTRNATKVNITDRKKDAQIKDGEFFVLELDIEYLNYPKVGDKLANRYGSKGLIARVVPDDEMLRIGGPNGRIVDLIMNPLSVFGRKNISQVYESNLSLIAEKMFKDLVESGGSYSKYHETLKQVLRRDQITDAEINDLLREGEERGTIKINVSPFDNYYSDKKIKELMKLSGTKETQALYDPISKKMIRNEIRLGYQYIMRLHFISEFKAKATSRSRTPWGFVLGYGSYRNEGQSYGEQEVQGLLAHGVEEIAQDIACADETKGPSFTSALLALGLEYRVNNDK